MDSSGDELTVNASNNFKLDATATATAAIETATINNTGSDAITVEATATAGTADNIATKLNLSGNAVTLKGDADVFAGTAATGATAGGVEVTSTATKSTIELSDATTTGSVYLNKAQVSEVLVSADVTAAAASVTDITVNENSKLVLAEDQTAGLTVDIENAKGTLATTVNGTLLLDVNASQTGSVTTGTNVDTVFLTAGKLADKGGKAQTVTISDLDTTAATTATIVVNGANDLVIDTLTGNTDDKVVGTTHTGKLTINDFTNDTKVFSGSNDDTFKVTAANAAVVLEINSGAGNDTVDLGASTAANQITLGAGNDTVVFAAAAPAGNASTIKDAVIGEDKIILTGTANNGAALNVAALGTITAGAYSNAFGTAHGFKLTGSTASDLSNLVQFGNSTAAYEAAVDLDLTTGSFNDVVEVNSASASGDINLGAGDDKITDATGYTGTITGGAGSDTFVITSADAAGVKIADLGATDILKVASSAVKVNVDVVESFTATAATTNAVASTDSATGTGTILTLKDGVNVDMTLAKVDGITSGYNIKTDAAVTTGATIVGSRGNDFITGSKFADTITGGEGSDEITAGKGADTIILTESFTAVDTVKIAAGDSLVTAWDKITGFGISDGTLLSDTLDFDGTSAVGTLATSTDYGTILSHTITAGIATFDDAAVFATALVINSSNVADVVGYLAANTATLDVVAFTYDSDNNGVADATLVYNNGTTDSLVQLSGVTTADALIIGANVAGLNDLHIA